MEWLATTLTTWLELKKQFGKLNQRSQAPFSGPPLLTKGSRYKETESRGTDLDEANASKAEQLVQSIKILNRTRESINSTVGYPGKPGQHLDKSLSKIILTKEVELESLPRVSVIVRSSTPNTSERCEESHVPFNPRGLPADYSLPLHRYLIDSQENSLAPIASIGKQDYLVEHRLSSTVSPPEVPWSPSPIRHILLS